ncbi:hypothetical protein [Sulfuricurvum sp.]|uniref:hypothetical protein n=1 Tax=Sulfuricurvum sp. TaxID=2025608 RepID=UPI00260E8518|nr:hypothetical protein [Sulfuricurvum sp.]MDD2265508.1 hypothetical protein [Sulfuricurvum sp.]MDD2783384.1 hypothetical protein [Sulfuricurvum sp.]
MNYNELSGKSILLLGKTRALNMEEFDTLLKLHKIERIGSYNDEVALIIEGRMMNPYEQAESARLYEMQSCPIVELSGVEEWLCRSIEPNRLLMSLKLSRNQERLVDFLQNPYITDELFFKLLKLYDWQNEGLFDNDTNRDVTASIIGRFYADLERNHNVQYAMSGLAHLIERYGNAELIEAISQLAPIAHEIKNPTDRSYHGVLDAIALHPDTPESLLRLLIKERSELLAHRVPLSLEEELLKVEKLHPILAQNESLSHRGAQLLADTAGELLAKHIVLDEGWFERFAAVYPLQLASNPTLTEWMQEKLIRSDNDEVMNALASNSALSPERCVFLYSLGRFSGALAANPSLPDTILEELSQSNDPSVLGALAANPSTPIDVLYQLSLDQRFERSVKTNPTFGKHIQTHNIGWS